MIAIWVIFALLSTGCTRDSLGVIRATSPKQTGVYQKAAEPFAACAKQQIETNEWPFGQPIVSLDRAGKDFRVNAIAFNAALFELMFIPSTATSTTVEFRRAYDGLGTQDRAWSIVETCSAG